MFDCEVSHAAQIRLINAALPGKKYLGAGTLMFFPWVPASDGPQGIDNLKRFLSEFYSGTNPLVFISDMFEEDEIESVSGPENILIYTAFIHLGPASVDRCRDLNQKLVQLYGTRTL